MTARLPNLTLAFVAGSQIALKKANDELEQHRSGQKRAAEHTSPVLKLLLEHDLVPQDQSKLAADMLADHAGALELLKSAVDKIVKLRATSVEKKASFDRGDAVDEQTAGLRSGDGAQEGVYDSLNSNYQGFRTGLKKASDINFERDILS